MIIDPQVGDSGGLSPRTRRNHAPRETGVNKKRSISAHAEEPLRVCTGCADARVYLRARGGTNVTTNLATLDAGLSPRTRRNLHPFGVKKLAERSISAHAEEPRTFGGS
ncbi:Hypothetical protein GbCGDNIH5_1701 [Granulibacter bethesdensis]|nr:Hypothetical protein GbCGDNIH5_1701 [Granulibacter bethesdensis]